MTTTTIPAGTITDKTIYIYNPETDTLIPYRPDPSVSVPFVLSEAIGAAMERKEHTKAPKANKELGVIVPLIRQPPNQSDWMQLATIAQKYPRINTVAVVSPTRDQRGIGSDFGGGGGLGPDPEYQNGIRYLQNAGITVAGYIDIGFTGEKTQDDLRREVDRWREWYPDVRGLFITPEKGTQFEQLEALAAYAKIDRAFSLIILDMAGSNYTDGGVINRADDYVSIMPAVDVFVIYNREGYPADGWYNSIRKGWMSKYNRSKFAFIPYKVGEDSLPCRNFIDRVVGIEKLAGYVYVHSAYETDRRKLGEWTYISPLLEITLEQLDREAREERIPFSKGVVPDTVKQTLTPEETTGGVVDVKAEDATRTTGTDSEDEVMGMPRDKIALDKFGVRKIYPSATTTGGGKTTMKEWYVFQDNPRADQAFRNLPDTLTKEADGSWSVPKENTTEKEEVRLEAWSPLNNKYLNVEITGYFKILKLPKKKREKDDDGSVLQLSAPRGGGGGKGGDDKYSAYNGVLLRDGAFCAVKDLAHNVSTGMRGMAQATNQNLLDRWIGVKTVIYNYPKRIDTKPGDEENNNNTSVALEMWVDDNVTDPKDGRLVVKNDWKHILSVHDEGGWFADTTTTKKKKNKKRNDKVLTESGGTKDANCVAFSWNSKDSIINFKYLSVREIDVSRQD